MRKIKLGHHQQGRKYKNPIMYASVDDGDFDWLNQYKWCANYFPDSKTYYVLRGIRRKGIGKTILMHRQILNAPKGMQIDHINHNGMDNRRSNLRLVTRSENQKNRLKPNNNTSGYKGVYWHKQRKKWKAQIGYGQGKTLHLGLFVDKIDAAHAYDNAAKKLHGEYAKLNSYE